MLLAGQLQGPFEGRSRSFHRSLSQIALTQKNLDHHPIGFTAESDLQMFTCSRKVTGIKQRSPQTESSQFVFRILPNHFPLPSKEITHVGNLTQVLIRSSVDFQPAALSKTSTQIPFTRWH